MHGERWDRSDATLGILCAFVVYLNVDEGKERVEGKGEALLAAGRAWKAGPACEWWKRQSEMDVMRAKGGSDVVVLC